MYKIPKNITFVLESLEKSGFEAYLVGGCVRDMLMNILPHDYDITTSATPDEIKSVFSHTADTGLRHGTVTVIEENEPIEVTTFRTEGDYTDSRHPDCVEFVRDITADLSRRDFTVNAICMNSSGEILDKFKGKEDIDNRILRAVGDSTVRFSEDALRILRLFRFSATLGFEIEENTLLAAKTGAKQLKSVSFERIADELKKAVLGDKFDIFGEFLNGGALGFCGINTVCLEGLSTLPKSTELRLFALLNTPENNLLRIAKRLKLSGDMCRYFGELSALAALPLPQTVQQLKRRLRDYSEKAVRDSLIYRGKADIEELLNKVLSSGEPYKISQLKIDGNDLLKLKIEPKSIGKALENLLELVIDDPSLNRKQSLIEKIK